MNLGAQEIHQGDTVLKMDFQNVSDRSQWEKKPFAAWVNEGCNGNCCLKVVANHQSLLPVDNITRMNINLVPLRGMRLWFRCLAKADSVTKPSAYYLGVRFILHYKSKSTEVWKNQNNVFGTFQWKELSFSEIIADDAETGTIGLGLQGSSGTVWFDSVMVVVMNLPLQRKPMAKAETSFLINDQSHRMRGVGMYHYSSDADTIKFRDLAINWKANVIRWHMIRNWDKRDFYTNIDTWYAWLRDKFEELDKVLKACEKYNFGLVIDLFQPPGGFDDKGNYTMFYDTMYNKVFIDTWKMIAKRFKGNKYMCGYGLINEPVQETPDCNGMNYLETQIKAAKAIRQIDKHTTIMISVDGKDFPQNFRYLVPVDIPNVVYQVHMYVPTRYTHQGLLDPRRDIAYPGIIDSKYYNKSVLKEILQPVRDFQQAYQAKIFVGEFGVVRWAPGSAQYLNDCIELFEEYRWDWTFFCFRESPDWDAEIEGRSEDRNNYKIAIQDTDRKIVLLHWMAKNNYYISPDEK